MSTSEEKKIDVSVSAVQTDVKAGLDRSGIRKKYGLTHSEVNELFKVEGLKGMRVRKPSRLNIINDVPATPSLTSKKSVKKAGQAPVVTMATTQAAASPATSSTPISAPQQETTKEEIEEEIQNEQATAPIRQEPIKEVPSADDNAEAADDKKSLW